MKEFITAYGPKNRVQIVFDPENSQTKQSFKRECDINNIMEKYKKTGAIQHFNANSGNYGFATAENFKDSMDLVTKAQTMFDALPSTIRSRFGGDPGAFLNFVQDPANGPEMITLGLTSGGSITPSPEDLGAPAPAQPAQPAVTVPPAAAESSLPAAA